MLYKINFYGEKIMFDENDNDANVICFCGERNLLWARDKCVFNRKEDWWEIFFDCMSCHTSFRWEYHSWYLMNLDWLRYRHKPTKKRNETLFFPDKPDIEYRYSMKDKGYKFSKMRSPFDE